MVISFADNVFAGHPFLVYHTITMLTSSFHDDKADGWHSIFRRDGEGGTASEKQLAIAFERIRVHERLLSERMLAYLLSKEAKVKGVQVVGPHSSEDRVPTISFVVVEYSNPFECDGELFLGSSPSLSVSEREKVWQDRVTADLQLIRSASWCKLVRHGLRVEVVSKRV
jgi:hypothetical protein